MIYNNKLILRAFFPAFFKQIKLENCLDLDYSNTISLPKCYFTKILYKYFSVQEITCFNE